MWDYIEQRAIQCAEYIIATGCTVRACSAHFNVSKSTVHKDVAERLKYINEDLYEQTKNVLSKNLNERHIRGGIATREKYRSATFFKGNARFFKRVQIIFCNTKFGYSASPYANRSVHPAFDGTEFTIL